MNENCDLLNYSRGEKLKKLKLENIRNNSGVPYLKRDLSLKEFNPINVSQEYSKNMIIKYLNNFDKFNKNGLFITGDSNKGKTHLLFIVSNEFINKSMSVRYTSEIEFQRSLNPYTDSNFLYNKSLFKQVDVLVVDDFGIMKPSYSYMENLFEIINYRVLSSKILIFGSSIRIEDLSRYFTSIRDGRNIGVMLENRIKNNCNFLQL